MKPPMLEVRGLSLGFIENKIYCPIFPEVSFTLHEGEILAIIGDSGAGKTSLLNSVAGFIRPKVTGIRADAPVRARMDYLPGGRGKTPLIKGDVLIDGHSVLHKPASERRTGMLLQSFSVFEDRSILDNLTFGPMVRGVPRAQREAMAKKALHLLKMEIENVDAFLKKRADELSGGERQRVALIRLVIDRPPIWLLDEPYANLDAIKREEISQDIRQSISGIAQDQPVCGVIVCHDLKEALHADKLLVMADHNNSPDWALAERHDDAFSLVRSSAQATQSPHLKKWLDRLSSDMILG